MKTTIKIDYSTIDTWMQCQQKAMWQYDVGYYRPTEERLALEFGSCVHKFLEVYEKSKDFAAAKMEANLIAQKGAMNNVDSTERYSLAHLNLLIKEYAKHYEGNPERYKIVETEQEASKTIYTSDTLDVVYCGRYDGVVTDTMFGDYCLLEHKTTYDVGEKFEWRTWPNLQAVGYAWLCQEKFSIKRVIYNAIQSNQYYNTKTKGLSGKLLTAPHECFIRYEVPIDDTFFEEFKKTVIQVAKDIVSTKCGDRDIAFCPPNPCTMFNSKCQYHDVCRSFPRERQHMLDFNYAKKPWANFKITVEK